MITYQATRQQNTSGAEETVFVRAQSRPQAIGALRRRGWVKADGLFEVPLGFDLPPDAEVIEVNPTRLSPPTGIDAIAASMLVRQPILTIAAGVVAGIVAYQILAAMVVFIVALIAGKD